MGWFDWLAGNKPVTNWFDDDWGVFRQPTKPYPFQSEGVQKIIGMGGNVLLCDDMGLGKTIQALLAWHEMSRVDGRGMIVVCPVTIKNNWAREARMHIGRRAEILEGTHDPIPALRKPRSITILNYEIMDAWYDYIMAMKPGIIVFDEGHKLCNRATARYKSACRLCERIPRRMILTGTPLVNSGEDLFGLLHIIDPQKYDRYRKVVKYYQHLRHYMIRRKKADVLGQLPKLTSSIVPLDLTDRAEYDRAERDFLSWLTGYDAKKATAAARAEGFVKVGYLKRLTAKLKLPNVIAWLDDFLAGTDQKIIVFAIHKEIIGRLTDRYFRQCVVLDGSTSPKKRVINIDAFTMAPGIRMMIANIDVAGVGWNGTAATAAAFVELPWVPYKLTQGAARINRIGQKSAATVYYLLGSRTIEERNCEILQEKQMLTDSIVDAGRQEGFTSSIYEEFLASMQGKKE